LLAHRPKNKRDVVHTEPQEEPLPPKRNERIAEESQRPASKSNYTPPASCPAKESERERRRREVYDSELVEDERGEGGEGESGWLASRENSPVKSPYSETMSTASSYSNKLKPNPTGPQLSIADFAVGQLLGSGKFGEVFVAQHRRTGFLCALKVVSRKLIDAKYLPQLVREVKIQSFLNHPNIVRLYGYFLDAKNFYLLQELCCSGQLYALLKRRRRLPE
jgi:aurora kinase